LLEDLHLNGTDRAGAQNEINVGCSICLMVFMVSDGWGWLAQTRARSVEGDIFVEGECVRFLQKIPLE